MIFELVASPAFIEQLSHLPEKFKAQVKKKLLQVKENPYKFKPLHSRQYPHAFRIRKSLDGKETRIIYVVLGQKILVAGLLERSKNYRDFELLLEKLES